MLTSSTLEWRSPPPRASAAPNCTGTCSQGKVLSCDTGSVIEASSGSPPRLTCWFVSPELHAHLEPRDSRIGSDRGRQCIKGAVTTLDLVQNPCFTFRPCCVFQEQNQNTRKDWYQTLPLRTIGHRLPSRSFVVSLTALSFRISPFFTDVPSSQRKFGRLKMASVLQESDSGVNIC